MNVRASIVLGATIAAATLGACGDDDRPIGGTDASVRDGGGTDARTDAATPICAAGSRRCDSARPSTIQTCPDGTGWIDETTCDLAAGEVCSVGECVEIHRTPACTEDADDRSYIGCELWGTTLVNAHASGETFAITVANASPFPVDVLVEGGALDAPVTTSIGVGALETIDLPWVDELAFAARASGGVLSWESGLVAGGAYRVRSSGPITVVQFNPWTPASSNDASSLLPASALGDRYVVLSTIAQGMFREWPASFAVVGVSEAATSVTVTRSAATAPGDGVPARAAGGTSTHSLGRGDVLQILGATPMDDLSGTLVEATGPVAVFSAHVCANFPGTACDHLEEQSYPLTAWGRSYVATTFGATEVVPFVVRIVAGDDAATVSFDPVSVSMPIALAPYEHREIASMGQFAVTSDEPILVAEMVSGRGLGGEDPSMVYAIPTEQHRPHSIILAPDSYDENFVNLIGESGSAPTVDGAAVSVGGGAIGSSGLSVWRVPLTPGVHEIGAPESDAAFGIIAYGFEFAGSYAYATGMNQRVINPPF